MKNRSILIIIFFIFNLHFQSSCHKDPICACGVEHPEVNIQWLKSMIESMFNVDIYKLIFENKEYIIICDLPGPDAISVAYDCAGTKICENGGFNPGGNICNLTNPQQFWNDFDQNKVIIYKCRNVPDR
jgi:hypothetical protein